MCLIPDIRSWDQPGIGDCCGDEDCAGELCLANGDIDVSDLEARIEEHRDSLAAMMVTYPSTHGVFEDNISWDLRSHSRSWRAGVHGRRKHERSGGTHTTQLRWVLTLRT